MSKFDKFIDKITSKSNKFFEKIGNKLKDFKDKLTNNLSNTIDKTKETLTEKGKEIFSNLKEDAKEFSTNLKEKVEDTAENIGIANPEQSGIVDTTGQNEDMPIGENYNMEAYKQLRDEAWEREDAIRKETQAREDTAWQRSVEDAQKAGINVNLMNMQPATSGGGITSATGIDTSAGELDLEKYLTELEGILDRELKADEGTKDRISDLISSIIFAGAMLMK